MRRGYDKVEGGIGRSYDEIKGVIMSVSRDFHMLGKIKWTDDTSLLVPDINTVSLEDEFYLLQICSQTSKLVVNMLKTQKIVFHPPNPWGLVTLPQTLANIENLNM